MTKAKQRKQRQAKREKARKRRYVEKPKRYGVTLREVRADEVGGGSGIPANTRVEIIREERGKLVIAGEGFIYCGNTAKPRRPQSFVALLVDPSVVRVEGD